MILRLPQFPESSLSQILTTKLVRVTAAALFLLLLIVFTIQHRDGFERIRPKPKPPVGDGTVWSRFAYTQYATNTAYLCNSVMLFEILNRLGSKPDRLIMHPRAWSADDPDSVEGRLLRKARDEYGVKLVPIEVQRRASNDREC